MMIQHTLYKDKPNTKKEGERIMKKILSLLLVAIMFITLTAPIVYASKYVFPKLKEDILDKKELIKAPGGIIIPPGGLPKLPDSKPDDKKPGDGKLKIPGDKKPGGIKMPGDGKFKLPGGSKSDPSGDGKTDPSGGGKTGPAADTPEKTPKKPSKSKTTSSKSGNFVTSEGPLFIMFRDDLTNGYEMFTPIDLSLDGEYVFPLISSGMHTVGDVIVTIKKGLVTVHAEMYSGVNLKDGILTFFDDISSVNTIKPSKLKEVDIPFDMPVNVMSRLGVDNYVLMYINCPVSYNRNSENISPFSLEDADYLERMYALVDIMD